MLIETRNPNLIQPDIEIFNIRFNQPVVMLTDLMISVVCFYAYYHLSKLPVRNKILFYIKHYFLFMGIATSFGGIFGHGLQYLLSFEWKLPGWFISMVSVTLLERATIEYARKIIPRKLGVFFLWLNIVELFTFMFISFYTLNFYYVIVHSTYGLLVVVFSFSLYIFIKTKSRASKLFLFAVTVSGCTGVCFLREIGINKWFNHFDVSHTFMAIGALIFYFGAKKMAMESPVLSHK